MLQKDNKNEEQVREVMREVCDLIREINDQVVKEIELIETDSNGALFKCVLENERVIYTFIQGATDNKFTSIAFREETEEGILSYSCFGIIRGNERIPRNIFEIFSDLQVLFEQYKI